jgi:hypothetical protein
MRFFSIILLWSCIHLGCTNRPNAIRLPEGLDSPINTYYNSDPIYVNSPPPGGLQPLDSDLVALVADKLLSPDEGYRMHLLARDRLRDRDSMLVLHRPKWTYADLREMVIRRQPIDDLTGFKIKFDFVRFDTTDKIQRFRFVFSIQNLLPDTIKKMCISLRLVDQNGDLSLELPGITILGPVPAKHWSKAMIVEVEDSSVPQTGEKPGMYYRRTPIEVQRVIGLLNEPKHQKWLLSFIELTFTNGLTYDDYGIGG